MIPNKTVAKKGTKSIVIKSFKQEKCRISVLLIITADGGKLPPYIIFKAKCNGKIESDLKKDINVIKKNCYVGAMITHGLQKI